MVEVEWHVQLVRLGLCSLVSLEWLVKELISTLI
jgi:hypothetical protein